MQGKSLSRILAQPVGVMNFYVVITDLDVIRRKTMSDPKCNDCIFKKTHANDLPCCDCFQGKHYRYDETEDLKQTLDDAQADLKKSEQQYADLKTRLRLCEHALRFYGRCSSYQAVGNISDISRFIPEDKEEFRNDGCIYKKTFFIGGKLARAALEKIKGMK